MRQPEPTRRTTQQTQAVGQTAAAANDLLNEKPELAPGQRTDWWRGVPQPQPRPEFWNEFQSRLHADAERLLAERRQLAQRRILAVAGGLALAGWLVWLALQAL